MYIRMSWGTIRSGYWDEYRKYYNERVAPSTTGPAGSIRGLQQRQLLRSTENTDEGISISLWESQESMTAYERSEARKDLLQEADHLHHPWAYTRGEYWVKHFEAISSTQFGNAADQGPTFVRMVWGKLHPGAWDQYEKHYHETLVASSGSINGLRERRLLRSMEDPDEGMSVSIWDSLENMRAYEMGEVRQSMARQVEQLYRGEYWVRHFEVTDTY